MSKLIKRRSGSLIAEIFYSNSPRGSGTSGVQYLNDLLDVVITNAHNGDVLQYNLSSNTWENVALTSVLSLPTPGGSDKQLQFNDNGAFGGANIFYDKAGDKLGFGTSSPAAKIEIVGDSRFLISNSADTSTEKQGLWGTYHYTSSEEPFYAFQAYSDAANNLAIVGGGTGYGNAATELRFVTANNVTTLTGTTRMVINAAGNVGINNATPNYRLDVAGDINLSGILKVSGNPFGIDNLADAQSELNNRNLFLGNPGFSGKYYNKYNTTIGLYAFLTPNTDNSQTYYGAANVAVGYLALRYNSTGFYNAAVGAFSQARNTSGYYNASLGHNTLASNTKGRYNTALGAASLYFNTTGSFNAAGGTHTLYRNETGVYNTAFGYRSLFSNSKGSYNTALGSYGLHFNTEGVHNIAVGYAALFENTGGNGNVAIGGSAGRYASDGSKNVKGSYNIFIGADTQPLEVNSINEIVIGHKAIGNGENSVTLGNDLIKKTILKGNVGIGTKSPSSKLVVESPTAGISSFRSSQPQGYISVFVPNINVSNRASILVGQGTTKSSGTLSYLHSSSSGSAGRAIELFAGSIPVEPARRMLRVTDNDVQVTTNDFVLQSANTSVDDIASIKYIHGRRQDNVSAKSAISSRLRDSYGRSDILLSVNSLTTTDEVNPVNDLVMLVDGITRRIGVHTQTPFATVDIYGTVAATIAGSPGPALYREGALYYDSSKKLFMVQIGGTSIPEKFRNIFENIPHLVNLLSFVDTDSWSSSSLPDYGKSGITWSVSGNSPAFIVNSPYGWGRVVYFDNTPTNQSIVSSTIPMSDTNSSYGILIVLYHRPDTGSNNRSILKFVPDTGDTFELVYNGGTLVLENTTQGTSKNITSFSSGDRIAILLQIERNNNRVRIGAFKRAGNSNRQAFRLLSVNTDSISSGTLTLGTFSGKQAMNMRVFMLGVLEFKGNAAILEMSRILKQISNQWLV